MQADITSARDEEEQTRVSPFIQRSCWPHIIQRGNLYTPDLSLYVCMRVCVCVCLCGWLYLYSNILLRPQEGVHVYVICLCFFSKKKERKDAVTPLCNQSREATYLTSGVCFWRRRRITMKSVRHMHMCRSGYLKLQEHVKRFRRAVGEIHAHTHMYTCLFLVCSYKPLCMRVCVFVGTVQAQVKGRKYIYLHVHVWLSFSSCLFVQVPGLHERR